MWTCFREGLAQHTDLGPIDAPYVDLGTALTSGHCGLDSSVDTCVPGVDLTSVWTWLQCGPDSRVDPAPVWT